MKLHNLLVVHKMGYNAQEKKTLDAVLASIQKKKIPFRCISRLEANHEIVKGRNLIIVVGGDGTFLKTAQYIQDATPVLCVTADPEQTEGFYSDTTAASFEKKLDKILEDKISQKILWRLIAKKNGHCLEPCLNEYYVGQQKPYDVAKYILQVHGKTEFQKSSGVLVSTAAGSTAWCRGAGGKIISKESKDFQFVVREPYIGKLIKTRIKKGILKSKEKIRLIAKADDMIIVADARGKEHPLKKEEKVEIMQYEKPIFLFY